MRMIQRKYDKLFVGGDLSGIQKFLYNITTKNASVSLKGRSAYLGDYLSGVCGKLELAVKNVGGAVKLLYCSGGKFYFITDNTPGVNEALKQTFMTVTHDLWREHRGQLGLSVSWKAFCEIDGNFYVEGHEDDGVTSSGVLWKYLNADFARMKNQKFKALMTDCYEQFFVPQKVGGKPKVCALTGVESDDCEPLKGDLRDDDGDDRVFLPSVIEQIRRGKELSKKEGLKTFEEYAKGSYLGILRMDVDGMGKKFIIGFPSLDEYETFSNHAKQFFENDIRKKLLTQLEPNTGKPYSEFLNIIYAGGDDLFIVGRWDKVIDFAKIIHDRTVDEFKADAYIDEFDSGKALRHISISGGVAVVHHKFPIAKAAEMAGEAEEAAKHYNDGEKDAFHIFGKTVSWNQCKPYADCKSEFDFVEEYKNRFVELIQRYSLSKSLLHKIMLYSSMADRNKTRRLEGKTENYSYIWHYSYFLTRYMERYSDSNVKQFCRQLRDTDITANNGRTLELVALAARWAELTLRINK